MKLCRAVFTICVVLLVCSSSVNASDEDFASDKMLTELENRLQLSKEKLSRLKPIIDERSARLKQSIHESVEQGVVQLDKMAEKLENASQDAGEKVQGIMNSEEIARLKEYLAKLDEDAIAETKAQIIEELTVILELSKEQVANIRPVLEDGAQQLGDMLGNFVKQGRKGLDEFKTEYDALTERLRIRLGEQLDKKQMDKFDEYNEERKKKIEKVIFV